MDTATQDIPRLETIYSLEDIIKQVEASGVNLGDDPVKKINTFVDNGLLPQPKNGRFASFVVQRIIAIQNKLQEGKSIPELKEEVKKERRRFLNQVTDLNSMQTLYHKFASNSMFFLASLLLVAMVSIGILGAGLTGSSNPVVVAGESIVKAALDTGTTIAKTAAKPLGNTIVTIIKTTKPEDSTSADPLNLTNLEVDAPVIPENLVQLDELGNLSVDGNVTATLFSGSGVSLTDIPWTGLVETPNIISSIDGVVNNEGNVDLIGNDGLVITANNDANTITFDLTATVADSSLLDSLDSSQFLRSDVSDNFTSGTLTLNAGTNLSVLGTFSCANCIANSAVLDALTISASGSVAAAAVTGSLTDSQVANTITASNYLPLAGGTMGGNIDFANNFATNIGAAGTDFTATGGLTLADDFQSLGHSSFGSSASPDSQMVLRVVELLNTAYTAGIDVTINNNASITTLHGIHTEAWADGDSTIVVGGYFRPRAGNFGVDITNMAGLYILLNSDTFASGTIGNAYGIDVASAWNGTPTVTNSRGIRIQDISDNTSTTVYGVEIVDQTNGATVYPIYQSGTNGENVFNADTSVFGRLPAGNDTAYGLVIEGALCVDDGTANCPAGPTSGAIYVENSVGTGNVSAFDIAEYYPASEAVSKGDVVSIDASGTTISKSSNTYDSQVLGVVSTKPAAVIDEDNITFGKTAGANFNPLKPYVALAGRVPVKVSTENGNISPGDPLTASSIHGVAMKATRSGPTIGKALESYNRPGEGIVMTFVSTGWYVAPIDDGDEFIADLSGITDLDVATLTATTITAEIIKTDELVVSGETSGNDEVKTGQRSITIENGRVKEDSKILVTFTSDYSPASRYWITKEKGASFSVHLDKPVAGNSSFSWLIIN